MGTDTPLDYIELRQLADKASPGPWQHEYEGSYIVHGDGHTIAEAGYRAADASFIAATRTAVPQLLTDHDEMARKLIGLETARRALAGRMQRIAEAHHKHIDAHGGTFGECNECGGAWPCPTYAWATSERDPGTATWDPADSEVA